MIDGISSGLSLEMPDKPGAYPRVTTIEVIQAMTPSWL